MQAREQPPTATSYDLILVGGGLANCMIALACLERRPGLRLCIVERQARLGGNHTWCLHPADVPPAARGFLEPAVEHRWNGYVVSFPGRERRLQGTYAAVSSARLERVVTEALQKSPGSSCLLGTEVANLGPRHVELGDGRRLQAALVVDARGPNPRAFGRKTGYQKFLGLELQLEAGAAPESPMLMDACVPQTDGFRFFYVLPLAHDRVLVEDTTFSPSPELDREATRLEVLRYAQQFGRIAGIVRDEYGVLPMPWGARFEAPSTGPLRAGYAGGFFHPATGYSFPLALRLACTVAEHVDGPGLQPALDALWRAHVPQFAYAQLLNFLLFNAFDPTEAWHVFERFYGLPEELVHRFYALSTTRADRARILIGAPPRGFSVANVFNALRANEVMS